MPTTRKQKKARKSRGLEILSSSLTYSEQPSAAETNSNDANENEADYVITRDEANYTDHAAHSWNERLNNDVTNRNEAN